MSGDDRVTDGLRLSPLARAYLTIGALIALVDTFNVFTAKHDAAEYGRRLATWEPAVWEGTSGVAALLTCGIAYAAVRVAPPERTRWPKFVVVHALASLVFSALHVILMNAMRVGIYAAVGHHYAFGESGFLYEYRKDLIAYIVWAAVFWLFTRRRTAPAVTAADTHMVGIQDGQRLIRVRAADILAIRAAGNYVEFVLRDGRRPLARKSLAQAHRELGEHEFVRTHRSWAVNGAHVRGLRPAGSGDFIVDLDGGTEAPLSRRFPDALQRFGGGGRQS